MFSYHNGGSRFSNVNVGALAQVIVIVARSLRCLQSESLS